jgi:hypothetical protein
MLTAILLERIRKEGRTADYTDYTDYTDKERGSESVKSVRSVVKQSILH